jgi:GNAT superfamily N-acetyltransferase
MKYQIASKDNTNEIISMKNRVKQRIIKANLPMWLNGYPLDEMIIEDILNNHGRVIIYDNKVVAYAVLYPSVFEYQNEIDDIDNRYSFGRVMVDDNYLGKGIGKFLVSSMIKEAKEKVNKGMLITGDDFNTKAMNLYKSLGFYKVGEKQFSYAYLSIFKLDF